MRKTYELGWDGGSKQTGSRVSLGQFGCGTSQLRLQIYVQLYLTALCRAGIRKVTLNFPLSVSSSYDNKSFSTDLRAIRPRPAAVDFVVIVVKRNNLLFPGAPQTSNQSNPAHFNLAAAKWLYVDSKTMTTAGVALVLRCQTLCKQTNIQVCGQISHVSDSILFSGWAAISVRCSGRRGVREGGGGWGGISFNYSASYPVLLSY